jgi:hypothetical protein
MENNHKLPGSPSESVVRGSAGTGRQAGLRILCRKAWGFNSPLPHHEGFDISNTLFPLGADWVYEIVFKPLYRIDVGDTLNLVMVSFQPADIRVTTSVIR